MKILAFVDVHADPYAIDRIRELAKTEKTDALVCAGDISDFGRDLDEITQKLDIGIPLLMIPGNHEMPEEIRAVSKVFPFVKDLHMKTLKIKDVLFIGCGGGGFSQYHTPFEVSEKKFEEEFAKLKTENSKTKTILITHAPPYDTKLDLIFGEHTGIKPLRKFIEKHQPAIAFCGHLHENAGVFDKVRNTLVVNPGKSGMIFEV